MADVIRARHDDTLDGLVWREAQLGAADLPAVLAINPGLAAFGATLPPGTPVRLPARRAPAQPVRDLVQLWD